MDSAGMSTESGTNASDSTKELRSIAGIVVPALLLVLILLLSLFGNVAVIFAILKTPSLREKTCNIFLINLSLTDLMNATLVMFSALVSLIADRWPFGMYWCYAQCAFNYWFIIVSMLTLAMISIDGYFAVVHPLRYINIITPKVTKIGICYAWCQGCVFALIPAIYGWVVYDYWEVVCAIDWDSYSQDGALTYVIVAFVACFLAPTCVVVFCYLRIWRAVRRSAASVPEVCRSADRKKQDARVIYSLAVVIVVYFICMGPFCITKVWKICLGTSSLPDYLNLSASWFAYVGNATNPFIYGIFRSDFRRAFVNLICRKERIHPSPTRSMAHQGACLSQLSVGGVRLTPV
ncbi:alpha-2A adrenergic receptor-like [Patiria miniata]|uniref:G-protein coupled receptors family 1 profile domain-containing protein n=1 Tax=Patiria miniata TaxID=46514 RepID=A0A914ALE8_PATMI|nr:alpha-2A adrenergic receptor-like [Patiria miniata]